MIVVDASILADVLTRDGARERKARLSLDRDPDWAAPEHWKIEVVSTIRGLAIGQKISHDQALGAIADLQAMTVYAVPIDRFIPRIWELRDNITAYDAAYVALAESLGTTLVTADSRLARAALSYCPVELIT